MKALLRRILPNSFIQWYSRQKRRRQLRALYHYDARQFSRYSAVGNNENASPMHALTNIIACYHSLEKGLSLERPRPCFGMDRVRSLLTWLRTYQSQGGDLANNQYLAAKAVLREYVRLQRTFDRQEIAPIELLISEVLSFLESSEGGECLSELQGGIRRLKRESYQQTGLGDIVSAMLGRCSCRQFNDEPVDMSLIEKAVYWAQKSPSVCNRQCTRIYVVHNRELIDRVLALHHGARGFGHKVDKLILVAGDLRAFLAPVERNQVFIDSGMFAMSLLYSLHYLGLGACPLHWAKSSREDKILMHMLDVDPSFRIVMLIGVGKLPEAFSVPFSQRRPVQEIIFVRPSSDDED